MIWKVTPSTHRGTLLAVIIPEPTLLAIPCFRFHSWLCNANFSWMISENKHMKYFTVSVLANNFSFNFQIFASRWTCKFRWTVQWLLKFCNRVVTFFAVFQFWCWIIAHLLESSFSEKFWKVMIDHFRWLQVFRRKSSWNKVITRTMAGCGCQPVSC